jgi:hypothetical protein
VAPVARRRTLFPTLANTDPAWTSSTTAIATAPPAAGGSPETITTTGPTGTAPGSGKTGTKKKSLTRAQKRARALKACRKLHGQAHTLYQGSRPPLPETQAAQEDAPLRIARPRRDPSAFIERPRSDGTDRFTIDTSPSQLVASGTRAIRRAGRGVAT